MATETEVQRTGAEEITWDLSDLYASIDDPSIEQDIDRLDNLVGEFAEAHRSKLASYDEEELYEALQEYEAIIEGATRIGQ